MRGVFSELVMCQDDNGFFTSVAPTTSLFICGSSATGAAGLASPAHTITWPSLGTTGYAYAVPTITGTNPSSGITSYVFTATKAGQTTITCTFPNGNCQ
jgi:hypothetical protein